jgi:hypothetical protein
MIGLIILGVYSMMITIFWAWTLFVIYNQSVEISEAIDLLETVRANHEWTERKNKFLERMERK